MGVFDGIRTGSWGTPEFGLTERLSNFFGQGRTSTGGSNLMGDQSQTTLAPSGYSNGQTQFAPVGGAGAYGYTINNLPTSNSVVNPTTTSTGGGGGGSISAQEALNRGWDVNNLPGGYSLAQGAADPYAQIRNDISSAWDNYLNTLNGTSGYIGDQRTAQEAIVNSQQTQGQNTINDQKAKSLRDISTTTRNAFKAGNNYLGSIGAGDSSANEQYKYAVSQQASKQSGDLNNFVNSQLQTLQSTHDQQMSGIAQWFANAQQTLKQQVAQGQLQKGQDLANLSRGILDQAMAATNQLKQNTQAQYGTLMTWAANNAKDMGQLATNIAGVNSLFKPGQVQLGAASTGQAGGYYPGSNANTKTDIFGNPIGQ